MKKIVAIAVFVLAMQGFGHAQGTDLRFGFQVSPMFSWMTVASVPNGASIEGNGTNLGLKLGVNGELYFKENYAFIVGIGFSFNSGGKLLHSGNSERIWQKSGEISVSKNNPATWAGDIDLKYKLQYVEIPLGMKFRTNEFGYIRYFVELPILNIGFNSQAKGVYSSTEGTSDDTDIKAEVVDLSLSWGVTGGIEYSLGENTSLVAGVGYQNVYTDVTKNYSDVKSKAHINNLIIRLGVLF
ncbi:MAG: PorT family protein [Lewinellaceae bacterium]|nr:PorT family protein [Saprospiraceae bacterium]MCB9337766.1 PorT family protein [Lewinellaceae bacterium]